MKKRVNKESNSLVAGIVGFLSDRGKTNLLSSVSEVLDEVVDKTKHARNIAITSAVPLTRDELARLQKIISRFLNNDLPVSNTVDAALIGGFSVRVGDFFLDASIASEITGIKQLLLT